MCDTAFLDSIESDSCRLDVLVNNSALGWQEGTLAQKYAKAFAVNAIGPVLVAEAFEPLLSKSKGVPRLINVSSGGGSMARKADPTTASGKSGFWGLPYSTSKAALNLITLAQASVYGTRNPESNETDQTKLGARGKPFKVSCYETEGMLTYEPI